MSRVSGAVKSVSIENRLAIAFDQAVHGFYDAGEQFKAEQYDFGRSLALAAVATLDDALRAYTAAPEFSAARDQLREGDGDPKELSPDLAAMVRECQATLKDCSAIPFRVRAALGSALESFVTYGAGDTCLAAMLAGVRCHLTAQLKSAD
jgi:hypothetical protein